MEYFLQLKGWNSRLRKDQISFQADCDEKALKIAFEMVDNERIDYVVRKDRIPKRNTPEKLVIIYEAS